TNFSNEAAWLAFLSQLKEGEKEFADSPLEEDNMMMDDQLEPNKASPSGTAATTTTAEDGSHEFDDDSENSLSTIFHIINLSLSQEHALLSNISNLMVLCLFNDVDVRQAPTPPPDTKHIRPPNVEVRCESQSASKYFFTQLLTAT
ncbi:hypothetical protein BDR06DRAFT_900642, partial [Suillus hirtellus]